MAWTAKSDPSTMDSQQLTMNFFNGKHPDDIDLTKEQYREYYAAEAKSEGFDVPYHPNVAVLGLVQPIQDLDDYKEELDIYGGFSLETKTDFEIVEFVKLNVAVAAGMFFYMTFKAKPSGMLGDDGTTAFQA